MSAVWLALVTISCVFCLARSGSENNGVVVWRTPGGAVTIQCRTHQLDQTSLALKKGLNEDSEVLFKEKNSKEKIAGPYKDRIQFNGAFPNLTVLIKNLTTEDTGPYRCKYTKFDKVASRIVEEEGTGSVLLVVTAGTAETVQQCAQANTNLIMVSVVISATVLIGIILGFLIWIILKTKRVRPTVKKPRRVANNDVYEDMRATIRR